MVGETEHWDPLPPMHHARSDLRAQRWPDALSLREGALQGTASTEVYDEALDRWIRLPCDFPSNYSLEAMSSALSL